MNACFEAAQGVYAEITAANPTFKKIYESQLAFKRDAYAWAQLSEFNYDYYMISQQAAGKL